MKIGVYSGNIFPVFFVGIDFGGVQKCLEIGTIPFLAIGRFQAGASKLVFGQIKFRVTCIVNDIEIGNCRANSGIRSN